MPHAHSHCTLRGLHRGRVPAFQSYWIWESRCVWDEVLGSRGCQVPVEDGERRAGDVIDLLHLLLGGLVLAEGDLSCSLGSDPEGESPRDPPPPLRMARIPVSMGYQAAVVRESLQGILVAMSILATGMGRHLCCSHQLRRSSRFSRPLSDVAQDHISAPDRS